jgi:hypothetical protein
MSNGPDRSGEWYDPNLATALTYIQAGFVEQGLHPEGFSEESTVASDRDLAKSYLSAAEHLPEPTEGRQGVILIVGNGAFEMAAQILPPEHAFIILANGASKLICTARYP